MRYMFPRYPDGKSKAVTFSYDDGSIHDIRLSDELTKHGLKCTFNINAGYFAEGERSWRLSPNKLREYVLDRGHEIAVHGQWHRANGKQRTIEGIRDVLDCRIALEREFGRIIQGMAYPDSGIRQMMNGADYGTIRNYLKELDVAYARTAGGDNDSFALPEDWYNWVPTAHHDNPEIFTYIEKFLTADVNGAYCARQYPLLLYIWGHSFEYDQKQNWDRLEKICGAVSGNADIWYATNMEIRAYMRAYEALVFSADGTIVHNPTVTTVWFYADGKTHVINPGETIKISE